MPRVRSTLSKRFTLEGGLNTDASPVNFPENASVDEQNMDLLINGTRRRRKALEKEQGATSTTQTIGSDDNVTHFRWGAPGGDTSKAFAVVKVGQFLHFYDDGEILSTNKNDNVIDLASFKLSAATTANIVDNKCGFSAGPKGLLVTHKYMDPLLIEYDSSADDMTATSIPVTERDLEGVDDDLALSDRPSTLSDNHKYNLINQGWTETDYNQFFTDESVYPSNADIAYLGKIENPSTNVEEFSSDNLLQQAFGTSAAPKGKYIISAFNRNVLVSGGELTIDVSSGSYDSGAEELTLTTSSAHGISVGESFQVTDLYLTVVNPQSTPKSYTVTASGTFTAVTGTTGSTLVFDYPDPDDATISSVDTSDAYVTYDSLSQISGTGITVRPSECEFYAGRVWFTGIESPDYTSVVYFTKIIQETEDYGKCYQQADPTSEHVNQLTDADGGKFVILDAGYIYTVKRFGSFLMVLAENGCWAIGPGEKGYFSPTSYSIRNITDMGAISSKGAVVTKQALYYLSDQGIVAVSFDEYGNLVSGNLSQGAIQDKYNTIGLDSLADAVMTNDKLNDRIIILYSTGNNTLHYDAALCYYERLRAFIPYVFSVPSDRDILGIYSPKDISDDKLGTKYLVHNTTAGTFTYYDLDSEVFEDFADSSNSSEADSYIITGYDTMASEEFPKTVSYIYTYFNKTETGFEDDGSGNIIMSNPSGCTLQTRWDWADHANSGKFGPGQEVYRFTRNYIPSGAGDNFEDGRPVVFTKNKVRGRGKSLHLKFTASTGKDCWLLGYAVFGDIVIDK